MNKYVLGSLLLASAILPAVLAWAIAHTYRLTKVVLWVLWVFVTCASAGLLSYAGENTNLLKGVPGWIAATVFIVNAYLLCLAVTSRFEPPWLRQPLADVPAQSQAKTEEAKQSKALPDAPVSPRGANLSKEQANN